MSCTGVTGHFFLLLHFADNQTRFSTEYQNVEMPQFLDVKVILVAQTAHTARREATATPACPGLDGYAFIHFFFPFF